MEPTVLLDALDDAALLVAAGRVTAINRAGVALLGPGRLGRDIRLAIRHPQAVALIAAGADGDLDLDSLGDGRPYRLSARALPDGVLLVRLLDRSDSAAAGQSRSDFVADASHELRTPLAALIGYAETLADADDLPAEQRQRFTARLVEQARRMERLIGELIGLSRIEADRYRTPSDPVDLYAIASDAVAALAPLIERQGARVTLAGDGPLVVAGDAGQLAQLVDNLVANALRHGCPAPGGEVTVRLSGENGEARLDVCDNGPGVDRAHLPRLTQRFFRADPARGRGAAGGSGLGLAIARRIADRHAGRIDFWNRPGGGLCAAVRLKLSH